MTDHNKESKEDDFEIKISEIFRNIDRALSVENKIEEFFTENYPEEWAKIPEQDRNAYLSSIAQYIKDPKKKGRTLNLINEIIKIDNKKDEIIILLLGVMLGVSGNLVANIIERYLSFLGNIYTLLVAIIFIFASWAIYYYFIIRKERILKPQKESDEIIRILNRVENYKP